MSYGNLRLPQAIKLDPTIYSGDPVVHALAVIVAAEVEAEREANRTAEAQTRQREGRPLPRVGADGAIDSKRFGLLGNPDEPPPYWADGAPWCELAVMPAVIDRCAIRANVKPAAMATAIGDILKPQNWMTFYWLGLYLEQTDQTMRALDAGIRRHKKADQGAVDRYLSAKGTAAGNKSGKIRAAKREASKALVVKCRTELLRGQRPPAPHEVVGKVSNKTGLDKSYVRELLKEHDEEMKG